MGLSANHIGDDGAKHLADVLMLNKAVETLYLEVIRVSVSRVGFFFCVFVSRGGAGAGEWGGGFARAYCAWERHASPHNAQRFTRDPPSNKCTHKGMPWVCVSIYHMISM